MNLARTTIGRNEPGAVVRVVSDDTWLIEMYHKIKSEAQRGKRTLYLHKFVNSHSENKNK
jgi:hypothetical protein